jgi:hypothetical protein
VPRISITESIDHHHGSHLATLLVFATAEKNGDSYESFRARIFVCAGIVVDWIRIQGPHARFRFPFA